MQRKEKHTVEKEFIRDIAREFYTGKNFEVAQNGGNFKKKPFVELDFDRQ